MKKIWTLVAICVFTTILVWCTSNKEDLEITKINNLAEILVKTSTLSDQFARQEITLDEFNASTNELQKKYEELTQNNGEEISEAAKALQESIDKKFTTIAETDKNKTTIWLPDWAKALGLSEPIWLTLQTQQSKQTSVDTEWYDSINLVYEGSYETALAQAKIIADKAKISISPEFKMAQEAEKTNSEEDIKKVTWWSENIAKGIVYSNAGLLENNMEYLITIAVAENGILTIEAKNFSQIKK